MVLLYNYVYTFIRPLCTLTSLRAVVEALGTPLSGSCRMATSASIVTSCSASELELGLSSLAAAFRVSVLDTAAAFLFFFFLIVTFVVLTVATFGVEDSELELLFSWSEIPACKKKRSSHSVKLYSVS